MHGSSYRDGCAVFTLFLELTDPLTGVLAIMERENSNHCENAWLVVENYKASIDILYYCVLAYKRCKVEVHQTVATTSMGMSELSDHSWFHKCLLSSNH